MPFVVPGQQQPQQQQRSGRGGGMEQRDYARQQPVPQPQYQSRPQPQQGRGGGMDPWEQQRQRQYRQPQPQYQPQRQQYAPQQRGGYQQQPQYRDPYGQRGGGRQYQQPQPRGYSQGRPQMPAQGSDEYNRYDPRARAEMDAQRRYQGQNGGMNGYRSTYDQPQPAYSNREMASNYARQQQEMYSNRPQQGNYVGEGVYADGTPMPPIDNRDALSLIQSNAGPAGGVYANFNQTPDVAGGVTPRAYLEEDETYNKPMRVGRGQGGIY